METSSRYRRYLSMIASTSPSSHPSTTRSPICTVCSSHTKKHVATCQHQRCSRRRNQTHEQVPLGLRDADVPLEDGHGTLEVSTDTGSASDFETTWSTNGIVHVRRALLKDVEHEPELGCASPCEAECFAVVDESRALKMQMAPQEFVIMVL